MQRYNCQPLRWRGTPAPFVSKRPTYAQRCDGGMSQMLAAFDGYRVFKAASEMLQVNVEHGIVHN